MTEIVAADTRVVILEAALRCFRTQGLRKTTIVDVGRAAGLARSTIYEYFPDKRAVVDAASEHASQLFYRAMATAMAPGVSLEDKLSRAAVAVTKARRFIDPEKLSDAAEVQVLLNRNAAALLDDCEKFLTPYIEAARLTGEVRKNLDVGAAAEWFSRMLFSLFMTPSRRLDLTDSEAVAAFVRAHVVRGYADAGPSGPRRANPPR